MLETKQSNRPHVIPEMNVLHRPAVSASPVRLEAALRRRMNGPLRQVFVHETSYGGYFWK